jgi:hypothetical protein
VRRVRERRQALGIDGAFGQRDGLPGVVGRIRGAAGARRRGDERAGARAADENSLPAEFGEGSGDGERAQVMGLDEPAGGGQPLARAEPGGLGPEPSLEALDAAIVVYEG